MIPIKHIRRIIRPLQRPQPVQPLGLIPIERLQRLIPMRIVLIHIQAVVTARRRKSISLTPFQLVRRLRHRIIRVRRLQDRQDVIVPAVGVRGRRRVDRIDSALAKHLEEVQRARAGRVGPDEVAVGVEGGAHGGDVEFGEVDGVGVLAVAAGAGGGDGASGGEEREVRPGERGGGERQGEGDVGGVEEGGVLGAFGGGTGVDEVKVENSLEGTSARGGFARGKGEEFGKGEIGVISYVRRGLLGRLQIANPVPIPQVG